MWSRMTGTWVRANSPRFPPGRTATPYHIVDLSARYDLTDGTLVYASGQPLRRPARLGRGLPRGRPPVQDRPVDPLLTGASRMIGPAGLSAVPGGADIACRDGPSCPATRRLPHGNA